MPKSCVTLEVGKLAAVVPDSLRFCFDIYAKDTMIEGAELEIIEIPVRAHCRDCGDERPQARSSAVAFAES